MSEGGGPRQSEDGHPPDRNESGLQWRGQSASVDQTMALGRAVGSLAQMGDVIALEGELGAGKTQFVRGLAEGMGLDGEAVSSPTFVLIQEYEPDDAAGPVLVHIDAYRLEGGGDLQTLGWDEAGGGPGELGLGAVVVVEWASRIAEHLPPERLEVELVHAGEEQRQVTVASAGSGPDSWRARWETLMKLLAQAGF